MVLKPGTGSFGTVCRCQVLLENEICISIKLVSSRKHEVLKNFLVYGCVDLGPQKTQWTNTSRWHGTPNHHWLWKLYTGPQATWILCLSSLPPDSGTLISKGNAKFTFIREHNFGPLSSSPVETLLTLSVVQEWLDTRNATAETHVLHTSVRSGSWSSCSPLFVNLPHIFEWVLFHNPLQGAVIPIACTLFFYHIFSFPSPLY